MDKSLYKISNYDKIDPFLMTVNSGSNHWMFLSSSGCLTAGREKAEFALFPYVTDDLLHRNAHFTGPITIVRIQKDNKDLIWEPFSPFRNNFDKERNLYKNSLGDIVAFEEINNTLGLTFLYDWRASEKYGFVRKSSLFNNNKKELKIEIIDGLRNILPSGIELRTQQEMSNLVNAYKVSEYNTDSYCALYYLNALLMDNPDPAESLFANIVWSYYSNDNKNSINEKSISHFVKVKQFKEDHFLKGQSGSYLTYIKENLVPEKDMHWYTVADVQKSQTEISKIISELRDSSTIEKKLEDSIEHNHLTLERFMGSADGFQCTENIMNDLHHTANVTYNVLRGGIFFENYLINKNSIVQFVQKRNTKIFDKYCKDLDALPENFGIKFFKEFGDKSKEPSLQRLCREYLPLTLGRRHGDPSRPWNHFNIRTKDEKGDPILYFEGNWRDIFQNWEALGFSYPEAWESMVCIFLNATSVDGYNPYRITSDGIDWEVIETDDSWSHIGYWNDHQIIYLLKLFEHLNNTCPKVIIKLFKEKIFSYANIPYRLKPFKLIVENPKKTLDFDFKEHNDIEQLVKKLGTDGKLVLKNKKTVYHVNMCEKIIVILLAKICNYVPGAGIWLNTQRPEWNDANNALVGNGTSMVTVYYLRRFLKFFEGILNKIENENVSITTEVWLWFNDVKNIVLNSKNDHHLFSDKDRMTYVSSLGKAFEKYRNKVYDHGFSNQQDCSIKDIKEFTIAIKENFDQTIHINKGPNGLFHAYNTIQINLKDQCIDINNLDLMLEGQVAGISSRSSNPNDTIITMESLFSSKLYREDMESFILYPQKELVPFLEKNLIKSSFIQNSKLLTEMIQKNDKSIIERDSKGNFRFNPHFRNSFDLKHNLKQITSIDHYKKLVKNERELILNIFEEL